MRTTITLEDDISAKLRERSRLSGKSFKAVVNEALRLGLNVKLEVKPKKPFRVRARALGLRPGLSYDNIGQLLEIIEEPKARASR